MAHIVFAWELGGSYGHITLMHAIAELLVAEQHRVDFIIPKPDVLQEFGVTEVTAQAKVYSAPRARKRAGKVSRHPDNFSEILLSFHYYDPVLLGEVVGDWRTLFEKLNPDLICFESAPTAILAARDLKVKTAKIGQYYFMPPDHYPMPSFTYNKLISNDTLKKSDDFLLRNIQKALNDSSADFIHDFLKTDTNILVSVPEVDFYAPYRGSSTQYYGSLISSDSFGEKALNWLGGKSRKKVFAYLKASYKYLASFLSELNKQQVEARIFISGMSQEDINKEFFDLQKNSFFELSAEPYVIDDALSEADLIVCHSGGGSVMHSIHYGKPFIAIPLLREQMMTAQRCIKSGIAVGLNPEEADLDKIKNAIVYGLNDVQLQKTALALKVKYSFGNNKEAQKLVVEALEKLLLV